MSIALGERSTELKELIEKQKNDRLMHQLNVDALVEEKTKAIENVRSKLNHELNETRRKSSAAEAAAAARGKTQGRGGSEERERERERACPASYSFSNTISCSSTARRRAPTNADEGKGGRD